MATSDTRSYMMAAEAATEIVLQKLEILISHPVRLRCLSTETQANSAKDMLAMILKFLSTEDKPSKSTEWLGWLLQAMYDAEEFIDKFHLRETCRRHKDLHMATRPLAMLIPKYMLRRNLSNLVKTVKDLCKDQYLRSKKIKHGPDSSSRDIDPMQGKNLERLTALWDRQVSTKKEKIVEWIRKGAESGDIHGISIHGEQGTGKTFLARWVYREAMYLGFDSCAWVRVSDSVDMREFLFEILKQVDKLARDMEDMGLHEITDILYKNLAKRKFLLVLDDVRPSNKQLLQKLMMIIPLHTKGHIITTTQDIGLARMMSSHENLIELKDLGPDEIQKTLAWKLHRIPDAQKLTCEEKHILMRCPGLPLCIFLLGGLLSKARGDERKALQKDGCMLTLLDILQLSYHRLPVHLKPCFIYMALFPVASPIPKRRLVRLWLAEGLLDLYCYDKNGTMTKLPESVGEMFILELADRNVIDVVSWRVDGSPKACQMLTSLYDMIRPMAMSMGFLHIHATSKLKYGNDYDPTSQQQQTQQRQTKVRWLAEHTNIVQDSQGGSNPSLNLSHVRSFLSFYPRRGVLTKDISTVLGNMTSKTAYSLLRVLDLEGVYKPSLQGVLHKLVLLKYLGLRSTVLDSIPSAVTDLYYLETLDIKHTNITSLPSSLWKARNLRHLHLNWFYTDLKNILIACNNVKALTKLQTLSGLVIGEVKENWMRSHMNSLTTLTTLKLFMRRSGGDTSGAGVHAVGKWICDRLTNLQSLTFGVIQEAKLRKEAEPVEEDKPATSQIGLLPELPLAEKHAKLLELCLLGQLNNPNPNWTLLLPCSLRVLTLSGSKVKTDMMSHLGNLLKNLRTFRLLANSFRGKSLRFIKGGFPNLMILKIWKLPQLEMVIIEKGAMPHLKELEFRHLERLETVEGINECMELENISLISQSDALVDQVRGRIEEKTNLHVENNTMWPGSTDDDENDGL